nr:carbamoyl-phosphate synthase small subunit [Atopobiaceae bacterium]
VVVHDMIYTPSSWQCEKSLPDYLAEQGVVGIEDIDVRALVAHLREHPCLRAAISTDMLDSEVLLARLQAAKGGEADA